MSAAIIRSISQLKHSMAILFCFFLGFAIVGMGLFTGTLRQRCFYLTSPDSPPARHQNISGPEFSARWTDAFGELTSPRSMKILSPTLKRLNLSDNADVLQSAKIREQAYNDNLWRLALPACGSRGLPNCNELCTNPVDASSHTSLGGKECPDTNGSRTVCRATLPFFGEQNANSQLFQGWCEICMPRALLLDCCA